MAETTPEDRAALRARRIIRVDGTEELLPGPIGFSEISKAIGCTSTDTVNLRHLGYPLIVMVVDDQGYEVKPVTDGNTLNLVPVKALKPVNPKATALYLANCSPGTTHQIVGDVVIVPDDDFAG